MPQYRYPGVYVEEVATGPRSIQAVGTSTAAFVGVAPNRGKHAQEVVAITNWSQFLREFAEGATEATPLAHAVFGYFNNGGSRCYVVNLGDSTTISGEKGKRRGLELLEPVDEVAIVAAPGYCDAVAHDQLLTHCEKCEDRVAILDCPEDVASIDQLTRVGTAPAPERRGRRSEASGGGGEGGEGGGASPAGPQGFRPRQSDRGFGAFYYPWIHVADPIDGKKIVAVPPSGHIAGVWARTDANPGVHKAPANAVLNGAVNVQYRITNAEQAELNPAGVNCIRFFAQGGGAGIRIWGARTVADASSEWRYLNVRRLFTMIEESIKLSTRWVVFEPNSRPLWMRIRQVVSDFLMLLYRDGALFGATPEEAFFVKCDEETNPPEVIDAGIVVTVIGIAPVKPAEFIVFRIGQHAGGAAVEV